MKNVHIILGAGFGDEGKGNFTNYLCTFATKPIVIRFSGGQQAGHTVIHNGLKHVFSNYGSGTLQNIPSYFSEHTCFYLNTMLVEKAELNKKGITPELYIHPLAKMTTPADVAFGRLRESMLNHGSCGLGIGSTMNRHETSGYKLYAIDILHKDLLYAKLQNIKKYYLDLIYKMPNTEQLLEIFYTHYTHGILYFQDAIDKWNTEKFFKIANYNLLRNYQSFICEGSQGIMLDKDHGVFPNVTYANTTSKNVLDIIKDFDCNIYKYYVTRAYQTRHGNGWMSDNASVVLKNTEEEINVYNEWQKNFKTCKLDYDLLEMAIMIDNAEFDSPRINQHMVYTCLDQIDDVKISPLHCSSKIFVSYSPESTKIHQFGLVKKD